MRSTSQLLGAACRVALHPLLAGSTRALVFSLEDSALNLFQNLEATKPLVADIFWIDKGPRSALSKFTARMDRGLGYYVFEYGSYSVYSPKASYKYDKPFPRTDLDKAICQLGLQNIFTMAESNHETFCSMDAHTLILSFIIAVVGGVDPKDLGNQEELAARLYLGDLGMAIAQGGGYKEWTGTTIAEFREKGLHQSAMILEAYEDNVVKIIQSPSPRSIEGLDAFTKDFFRRHT